VHGAVIRAIQLLAVEGVEKHRPAAVMFEAAHLGRILLEGDQPAFFVACMSVGVTAIGLKHADLAIVLKPAQRPVVGQVTEYERAPVTHPYRPFEPQSACLTGAVPEALERRLHLNAVKAGLEEFPGRLWE
jgi:hypothetical protein